MIATVEYVERKFREFNEMCFDGALPMLPIKTSNARTFLGIVECNRVPNDDGTWRFCNFRMRISTLVDRPEAVVDDTILHEMIHYYILYNQLQDTAPHGELFLEKMHEINRKFDRNLSVSYSAPKGEADKDTEVREHLVCVMMLHSGQCCVTVAGRSRLFNLWDEVAARPEVAEWKWYRTTNPYFNRYQRSIVLKSYRVERDEVLANLTDARELQRRGSSIFEKK